MLESSHFEAGKNLNKGSRQLGSEKILVELIPQPLSSSASSGGSATETLDVAELKKTDEVVSFTQTTLGGGIGKTLLLAKTGSADGKLDCEWDADPGAGSIVKILVVRNVPKS